MRMSPSTLLLDFTLRCLRFLLVCFHFSSLARDSTAQIQLRCKSSHHHCAALSRGGGHVLVGGISLLDLNRPRLARPRVWSDLLRAPLDSPRFPPRSLFGLAPGLVLVPRPQAAAGLDTLAAAGPDALAAAGPDALAAAGPDALAAARSLASHRRS